MLQVHLGFSECVILLLSNIDEQSLSMSDFLPLMEGLFKYLKETSMSAQALVFVAVFLL